MVLFYSLEAWIDVANEGIVEEESEHCEYEGGKEDEDVFVDDGERHHRVRATIVIIPRATEVT